MIFENRFDTTKEMYQEFVRKVLCRKINTFGAFFSLIAVLVILISIRDHPMLAAVEGTCLFILLFVILLSPRTIVKQLLEAENKMFRGDPPECRVIFGENIQMTQGSQSITIEYDQVIQICRLKTCSILMFTKQNGILYVEDRFTLGTAEAFEPFILEKCGQAKQIDRR